MINNKKIKGKNTLAISQIVLLVVGIIAFSYAVGSSIPLISAPGEGFAADMAAAAADLGISGGSGTTTIVSGGDAAAKLTGFPKLWNNLFGLNEGTKLWTGIKSLASNIWGVIGPTVTAFAIAAAVAAVVYGFVRLIGGNINDAQSWAYGAGSGTLALAAGAGWWALPIALLVVAALWKSQEKKAIVYQCLPWQAPISGKDCEKCNTQGIIPCTEYMCHSLGQGCVFEEELCIWKDQNDLIPPIMRPWKEALEFDYHYSNPNAVSPPAQGVEVIYEKGENGCAAAFSEISFGVTLDEPGRCKLDFERKPLGQGNTIDEVFESMLLYMDNSNMRAYNHSQTIRLPGSTNLAAEDISVDNGGEYEAYIRCMDVEGNINPMEFAFKFCVEEGPDTDAPEIIGTDWLNGAPIPFDLKEVKIEVYVNEPAECKWSHDDKSYNEMEYDMVCPDSVSEMGAQMLYTCDAKLDGLQNLVENKFYFRCKDQPALKGTGDEKLRNTNEESYLFSLIGTRPLIISDVAPNGTIRGSTDPIKVTLEAKTSAGWNEGQAVCYSSDTGKEGSYIQFGNTGEHEHSTDRWLSEGDYKYFIRCMDLGGNFAIEEITFTVEIDLQAPIIVRVYHEGNYLKIITDENATCVYSTDDCKYLFEDGIKIAVVDETDHFTDWQTDKSFYVKCQDSYGNRPSPDKCNMVIRPFELYSTIDE